METELAEAQAVYAGGAEMERTETPQGCTLDDDLFSGGRSKVKLTRSQKRAQKQLHQHKMGTGALDVSAVELQLLQLWQTHRLYKLGMQRWSVQR